MTDLDLIHVKEAIANVRGHEHPARGEDLYCLNLVCWLGERTHLLVNEIEQLRTERGRVVADERRKFVDELRGKAGEYGDALAELADDIEEDLNIEQVIKDGVRDGQ